MLDDYAVVMSNKVSIVSEIPKYYSFSIYYLYKNNLVWFIAHLLNKLGIKVKFYNSEIKTIKQNNIIVFDLHVTTYFLNYLKLMYPNKRIIFWYWNSIDSISFKPFMIPDGIEIWSYVLSECKKYKLKYNTSFYSQNIRLEKKIEYDVFFVGKDKDRKDIIYSLKRNFENFGMKVDFHIVKNTRFSFCKKKYDKRLTYIEVLKRIEKAKAILDIYIDETDAFTVRPLEALFLKKKLITNNKKIKELDFYNPNNIFILGDDDENKLVDFINSPFMKINNEIVEKYDSKSWILRFDREKK